MRSPLPFQSEIEGAFDAIFLSSSDGVVTYANPAARSALAELHEPIVGKPIHQLIKALNNADYAVAECGPLHLPAETLLWLVAPRGNLPKCSTGTLSRLLGDAEQPLIVCRGKEHLPIIYANAAYLVSTNQTFPQVEGKAPVPFIQHAMERALALGITIFQDIPSYAQSGDSLGSQVSIVPLRGKDPLCICKYDNEPTRPPIPRESPVGGPQVLRAARMATLGQLAVGVSHEIKNPLMMMTGMLELALEGLADGDVPSAVRDIRQALNASGRITDVIDRLLALAQPTTAEPQTLSLHHVVARSHRLLAERLRLAGIRFTLICPHHLEVRGHPEALEQVFVNLFLNSREAIGQAGGWVKVNVTEFEASSLEILIQDSGPGVPEAVRPRIFDPFFSTKSASSGTGLGLAICREAVRAHGGEMSYESLPNVGATFRIILPQAPS